MVITLKTCDKTKEMMNEFYLDMKREKTPQYALFQAQDGDTVTLLASTSIDENVIIQKNITLNLAGQTLLANANLQAEGQLNITDTNGGKIILQ